MGLFVYSRELRSQYWMMNVDLIRAIDKWVGIPVCLLVSVVKHLLGRFSSRPSDGLPPGESPRRVLFLELSEMGSTVLAYPSMTYVLDRHPGVELFFLIFQQNRFSVDILNLIPRDNVLTISIRSPFHFLISTFKALLAMRRANLDVVFDLELFSRFSALLAGMSGAPVRAGYGRYHEEGLYRGSLMTHRVLYNPHQHMARNFMALVKSIEREDEYPLLKETIQGEALKLPAYHPTETDLARLKERLKAINPAVGRAEQLILVNPNAGDLLPIRAWPIENHAVLAERILERFNCVVIVIGLGEAGHDAEKIITRVGSDRCVNFTNQTSFKDLFDLLSLADLLVTADGGPGHFATLTPIKSIVLFGPETPALYAPLGRDVFCLFAGFACSPCLSAYNHRKTSCTDPGCMKAISVDQVFKQVCVFLGDPGRSRE
jgi:ADP-heptose:LPS heptosyltransferase